MWKKYKQEECKMIKKIIIVTVLAASVFIGSVAFAESLTINGSTTVLPFAQAAVEKFISSHTEVNISLSGGGTGNGIKALTDKTANIANASRFIKFDEVKAAVAGGAYPVPFAVALDCLIPMVHPSNPVDGLTTEQLKGIYSGKITNWKEVGGNDVAIVVVGRDTSSGTYGTWQEMIMDAGGKTRVTPRAQTVASSGAMLSTVANNKNSIGYDGIGYIDNTVKPLTVNQISGNAANAKDGSYPLSRYLYMFTDGWPQGDTLKFINFMLSDEGQTIVEKTGFIRVR
jgi:phosphate transport system substrate-binding protein